MTDETNAAAVILKFPPTVQGRARFYFASESFRSLCKEAMSFERTVKRYVEQLGSLEYHLLPEAHRQIHAREAMSLRSDAELICVWFLLHDGLNKGEATWDQLAHSRNRPDLSRLFMRLSDEGLEKVGPQLRGLVYRSRDLSDTMIYLEKRFGFRRTRFVRRASA